MFCVFSISDGFSQLEKDCYFYDCGPICHKCGETTYNGRPTQTCEYVIEIGGCYILKDRQGCNGIKYGDYRDIKITFNKMGVNGGNNEVIGHINKKLPEITFPEQKKGYWFAGYYSVIFTDYDYTNQELLPIPEYWYNSFYVNNNPQILSGSCEDQTGYAAWIPIIYNCTPGEYLNYENARCETCTANNYCPGGQYKYDNPEGNQGIFNCPEGTTSDKGATNDGENGQTENACYSHCSNEEWLPKNSRKCEACPTDYLCKGGKYYKKDVPQGIYLCGEGYGFKNGSQYTITSDSKYYYLDTHGNIDKRNKEKPVLDLVVGEKVCYPCSGLYSLDNDSSIKELKFKVKSFCLDENQKPIANRANSSSSRLGIARNSCYISGSVDKNWGDDTIKDKKLEIIDNCFYNGPDGTVDTECKTKLHNHYFLID